jgi:Fe-S cluster assembly ATP-binding protein
MDKNMINRSVNVGFSGGERKKNEILQMTLLEPKLIILDEIDSGLDIDSLRIVADNINNYKNTHPDTAILIITHYQRILDYIKPDFVHIMTCGKIIKTGDYKLALELESHGFDLVNSKKENTSKQSVIKENESHE